MNIFGLVTEFDDYTYKMNHIKCQIRFSKFGPRFRMAQEWLDREIVKKMAPVLPYRTGRLHDKILQENESRYGTGRIQTVPISPLVPYGKRLYSGINPNTGLPYHWTNPLTQPKWGTYAVQNFKADYVRGVKHILMKGKKPDG